MAMNTQNRAKSLAMSGLCVALTLACVGCQRAQTQRVAFEHSELTLSPELGAMRLASADTPRRGDVDAATALRLAALGVVLD